MRRLIGKDPEAGKDWGQEEKGMTEDEMAASPTQWTWVWANSGRQWRTGKPSVLQSIVSQRAGHNLATEQQVKHLYIYIGVHGPIASICWIIGKAKEFQKNIYFCFIDYAKVFVWITTNCGKFFKSWEYQTTLPASWEICMQVKKQ